MNGSDYCRFHSATTIIKNEGEQKKQQHRHDCNALFTQDMFIIVAAFFCVYLLRRNLPQLLQISSLFL